MRKILCAGGFLLVMAAAHSQPAVALSAGSQSRHPLSALSVIRQPVNVLSIHAPTLALAGEKKMLLPDYGEYSLALVLPEKKNGFAFSSFYRGSALLHFTDLSLGYARHLGTALGLSVQFNYWSLKVAGNYPKHHRIFTRLGVALPLTSQCKASIHISDPFWGHSQKGEDRLPGSEYVAGLGYDVSEKCYAGMQVRKEEAKEPVLVMDLVYSPVSFLKIHGGIQTGNASSWIGICWKKNRFRFGLVVSVHQILGISPLSIAEMEFKKEERP